MNEREISCAFDDDPERDASRAGLRYVAEDEGGYSRLRWGRGFTYRDERGDTVRSRRLRSRFASLVIPPAWTDVWICRDADGHLQATGRDAEGRKQHIYHAKWREVRDELKFRRMVAFGWVLPRIRREVTRDLASAGLGRRRVLAAAVRLLDTTCARVGYAEYAESGSFGLATIRKRHVEIRGGAAMFEFVGKSGTPWRIEVNEPEVVEVIRMCMQIPGYELFKFYDEEGDKRDVTAYDINDYLREASGHPVRARDFRTWAATVLAASTLDGLATEMPTAPRKTLEVRTVERVAEHLHNTPAVCRGSYICPAVLEDYEPEATELPTRCAELLELRPEERAVLAFLEQR